jgi:hypothetical protein
MAENHKPPHDLPPLADKGAARPLAQTRPSEPAAADAGEEKRPSGLHTRPDLFGSSAVMPRPDDDAAEDANAPGSQPASQGPSEDREEDRGEDRGVNRPSDASASAASFVAEPVTRIGRPISGDETIGAPDASGRRATPVGVFLPVANLQDQPLRIPDSIAFEDWPDTPDSEPEAGARSPEGASMAASEPGPEEPAPSEEISATPDPAQPDFGAAESDDLAVPEKPAEAAAPADWQAPDWQTPDWQDPNRQPDPSAGQPDRFQDLLARLETGIDLRRLSGARWLLPAGITACAVLLVAGLAVGIIPIPGEDRQTAQLAQDLDEPAAGDPDMSASLPGQQDVPVAPAGSDLGNDSAAGLQPEEAAPGDPLGDALGDAAGDAPGASQLAALPEPGAPNALDSDREPIVDFMRIDPDGKAVVAGRAAPGTELTVLDNGEPLGTVTADIYGLWTFVSQDPLSGGRHEIGLRIKNQGSEVSSEPVLVTEGGSLQSEGPETEAELENLMTAAPEETDFTEDFEAPEQLAAAVPQTPVQSDASVSRSPAEPGGSSAEQPAVAPSPADQAVAAATPAPGGDSTQATAEEPAEESAAEPAAEATATVPAPAPKPEPPAETQIARAVPAGGDYVIQFASFLNPETAVREQTVLEERFSDLLTGHEVFVQQVDIADQGTFYRVRLGPFATLAEARTVCSRFQERERDCLAMAR